ncbi:MAG TPA: hypothetical protein VNN73_11000 [Blastocatellia bacterium]|nr:hypothetical protein [Blastocatellia bacterium]
MRTQKILLTTVCALALLASGASAVSQSAQKEKKAKSDNVERQVVVTVTDQDGPAPPAEVMIAPRSGGDAFVFSSIEMSFNGKVVKGAPYSAQATTETVQTLADGNRIVRKNTAAVYRDSEGRTRREQTISAVGPFPVTGESERMIFINDPVAGANYILNERDKTARKMDIHFMYLHPEAPSAPPGAPRAVRAPRSARAQQGEFDEPAPPPPPAPAVAAVAPVPPVPPMPPAPGEGIMVRTFDHQMPRHEPKTESLGKQVIEGVEAEGTRSTITIPAGEIGNEQPINIVSESWYSPELQTVVMSRHSDPRFGETTFRLTNINRSEPARTLFEVPSDYKIDEVMPRDMRFKIEREIRRGTQKKENEQ